jgi:transcriptional regulator with XRE-family HTH domain
MTSLKKLLAFNTKERRRPLGISQATLAEWVNTSTHYIAMIELERKTPSLVMLERIAAALRIDPPELFSMRQVPSASSRSLHRAVLEDIEQAAGPVITGRLNAVEYSAEYLDTIIEPSKTGNEDGTS